MERSEIRDVRQYYVRFVHIRPFLVLSPRIFNAKTSLVIGLSMSTAEYNVRLA